ncbi:hypothetical protein MC7420_5970 [Coleofasciculus chthonoplastes PCC 7420]|uniref:Uncharacterized protein n=1 Tax=Coleofasciculus chthonoplastes PCC 7420 TaxID=118168 RepID=B4W4Z0_9CYAN|nr:hypothetical protein MC7420_5970 [Coleofasciculus chthonoplastes PCC 7420]
MKQGEQRQQGKRGEILAVQLFLPSCTRRSPSLRWRQLVSRAVGAGFTEHV